MTKRIYQVDAFADKIFSGNPAAVCPLSEWLSNELMQKIAMENNLAETAFYVKNEDQYEIRWFTPILEVDLCGHATLAAAYGLFNHENYQGDIIRFFSPRSGLLMVSRQGDLLTLNFPADVIETKELNEQLTGIFGNQIQAAFKGKTDYMIVFERESEIKQFQPDFHQISKLDGRGVIITAKGDEVDFVSRFFAPQSGIPEDPVTGSAHTTLTPYWSEKLNKKELKTVQLSDRRGYLICKNLDERIEISGKCKLYMMGEILIDHP